MRMNVVFLNSNLIVTMSFWVIFSEETEDDSSELLIVISLN